MKSSLSGTMVGGFVRRSSPAAVRTLSRTSLKIQPLEDRTVPAVGGGFVDTGLVGNYYTSSILPPDGTAGAFTRRDNRLDFDLSAIVGPGGSPTPAVASVSPGNYSVRWSGQILPAFFETYRFFATADEGVRVLVRPAGGSGFTTVVDSTSGGSSEGTFAFAANSRYDVRVEFRQTNGGSKLKLEWSSPSTLREVIEPVSDIGINVPAPWSFAASGRYFADAVKSARPAFFKPNTGGGNGDVFANVDGSGYPTEDAELLVWEGAKNNNGTYRLSFKGQATVAVGFGTFRVNGIDYTGTLPKGIGYNAATDTTAADFTIPANGATFNLLLRFQNTVQQTPGGPTAGVSNVSLMRPTSPGATTSYAPGTLFTSEYLSTVQRFTVLRTMEASGTNASTVADWSDRTTPTSWFSQNYFPTTSSSYRDQFNTNGVAWEYLVALANESGKDLYINVPHNASADYIAKLANLIKYGSDGINPYTSTQANPVWSGLNPNLRIYLEYSNEIWNTAPGFSQYQDNFNAAVSAVQSGSPEGAVLNFDGLSDTPDSEYAWAMRRAANQTKAISDAFRVVFGDAAMTTTVRPVLGWFNDNLGGTARAMLSFLDGYYNNAQGNWVANPMPISSYIWGAGGGSYFGAANAEGLQSAFAPVNGNFETPVVSGTVNNPGGAGWTFTGNGGIVKVNSTLALLKPTDGTQLGFLAPGASVSQTINISQPGVYGLRFQASTGSTASNLNVLVNVYVNNVLIAQEYPYGSEFAFFGTKYRNDSVPGYFQVTSSGSYNIRIESANSSNATIYIDNVSLTSSDAIFDGELPQSKEDFAGNYVPTFTGNSRANYQRGLALEVNWAKSYGLNAVSYEGGWALGGVSDVSGVMYYAKYNDTNPLHTQKAQIDAINDFKAAGGGLLVLGSFPQWEDALTSAADPLVTGIDDRNRNLPVGPTNGFAVAPGTNLTLNSLSVTLVPDNFVIGNGKPGYVSSTPPSLSAEGNNNWVSWNVVVPPTLSNQSLNVQVSTSGTGTFELWVDNVKIDTLSASTGGIGNAVSRTINLGQGQHNLRIRALTGTVRVGGVVISPPGVTPPATSLPSAPTNLTATSFASPSSITLNWTDTATNETSYRVERATNPNFTQGLNTISLPAGSTSAVIGGLSATTNYYFRVTAVNTFGTSAGVLVSGSTTGSTPTKPASPTNPSFTNVTLTSATFNWADNATNETGYRVERATNAAFTTGLTIATLGAGSTSFTATGLQANTSYFFRVTAVNGALTSGSLASSVVTTPVTTPTAPAAPSNAQTTNITASSVTLTWTDNATNETGYRVEIATNAAFTAGLSVLTLAAGSTSNAFNGLTASTAYFFRITALNGALTSTSITATATTSAIVAPPTTPTAPTGAVFSGITSSSITLSWTDNATNETGYRVDRATDANFTVGLVTTPLAANSTSLTATGLTASTLYYFRVTANNAVGDSGQLVATATTQSGVVNPSVPAAPTGLTATSLTPGQVRLRFTDNSNNETGFAVERSTNNVTFALVTTLPTGAGVGSLVTFDDTGLTAGTTYFYRVRAVNGAGGSVATNASATTVNPADTILNADFETPVLAASTIRNNPTGGAWGFNARSGVVANGGLPGSASAFSGTQAGFLQGSAGSTDTPGVISQSIRVTDGDYRLTFQAAARVKPGASIPDALPIRALLIRNSDGAVLRGLTLTPTGTGFQQYSVPLYTLPAGNYTIQFDTLDTSDAIALIDAVKVSRLNIDHLAIGNPSPSGDAGFDGSVYTVSAGGQIAGNSNRDDFRFVRQDYTGDATAMTRVTGFDNAGTLNPEAKAGIMFRAGDPTDIAYAYAFVTPGRGVGFSYRSLNGTNAVQTTYVATAAPTPANPVYLRVLRVGNNFTGEFSLNGVNWTQIGQTVNLVHFNANAKYGLAVTSNTQGQSATARFSALEINAPVASTVVGVPPTAGTISYDGTNTRLTLTGSGNDLLGAADALQFASVVASNNNSLIAQISGITGGAAARVGIAVRDSLATNASYVGIFITGTGAVQSQSRVGGITAVSDAAGVGQPTAASPIWLRIIRKTNVVSVSYALSNAGEPVEAGWVALPDIAVTLPTSGFYGLAVTTGDGSATLASGLFRNVKVIPG